MLPCILSPDDMKRSRALSGVKVVRVASSGLAGAWATQSFVTKANSNVSIPILAAQLAFWNVPLTGSSSRLNTFIAAHQRTGSQALAPTATAQVGHGTQPGG